MPTVVADTGPLRYLVLLDEIELLPTLFRTIFIPEAVHRELSHVAAPSVVRRWIGAPPPWLVVRSVPANPDLLRGSALDIGEAEALALGRHSALILF